MRIVSKGAWIVSPRMLVISIAFHVVVIIVGVVLYSADTTEHRPEPVAGGRVKLVDAPAPPAPETLANQSEEIDRTPDIEQIHRAETKKDSPKDSTNVIEVKKLTPAEPEAVKLKKRKRRPVKLARKPEKKEAKTKKEAPDKPKSPDEIIAKRIAALKEKLKHSGRSPDDPVFSGTPGPGTDKELMQWFSDVRGRIGSHWSMVGSEIPDNAVTVIGIDVEDDGVLLGSSVLESSGHDTFDRSALRAVHQAAPFPPLPAGASRRIKSAGGLAVRFTPRGIR